MMTVTARETKERGEWIDVTRALRTLEGFHVEFDFQEVDGLCLIHGTVYRIVEMNGEQLVNKRPRVWWPNGRALGRKRQNDLQYAPNDVVPKIPKKTRVKKGSRTNID